MVAFFVNALFGLYYALGNLGWAIVVITVIIRVALIPLVVPSLKSAEKIRKLQPKLKKLQEEYKDSKEKLAAAQMELYKREGVNPLSGCLPQLAQIAILIIFFSAFNMVTGFSEGKVKYEEINKNLISSYRIDDKFKFDPMFLGSDLTLTPGKVFESGVGLELILPLILLLGSGYLQYLSAKLMMPGPEIKEEVAAKTPNKEDDMMSAMRTQSLYMMPGMTVLIGWSFSLGLLLYWFVNSAVMVIQQLAVNKMNTVKKQ